MPAEPRHPDPHIAKVLLVPGHPHILLASEQNPGWQALREGYAAARREIEATDADLILLYSTQWLSVLGNLFQADPTPTWTLVDQNWYELGDMPYAMRVDAEFAKAYLQANNALGMSGNTVNYHGFPIDTGTVVAWNLLNRDNRLPMSMVSCNMYAEKDKTIRLGIAGRRALEATGRRAVVVLVSALSNRYHTTRVPFAEDRISSLKDDEWNRKLIEMLGEGRLEDVSQVAREVARQANGDMGFKGIWWLAGITGQHNRFTGQVHAYAPVYGTGAAVVSLTPALKETLEKESDEVMLPIPEPAAPSTPSANGTIRSSQAPEPVGPYPHAKRVGNLLFVSGIGPRQRGASEIPGVTQDDQGNIVAHDIRLQTRSCIENIQTILREAGLTLANVVDVQVFLTDLAGDFAAFNEVYGEYFAVSAPTRTTVEVERLPTAINVELKVIAVVE